MSPFLPPAFIDTPVAVPWWSQFRNPPGPLIDGATDYLEEGRGWPLLSLSYGISYANSRPTGQPIRNPMVLSAIPLRNWPLGTKSIRVPTRALPTRPIWPGFAINTVFYAAILWGLFAAPFALRRRLRIKRGQCPACAYPVGSSDVCTECGKPIPQFPDSRLRGSGLPGSGVRGDAASH